MDTLTVISTFFLDMARIWLPFPLTIALLVVVGAFTLKTIRTARHNAEVRAERARRDAWRAPVLQFPIRTSEDVA